ncbi:MAG: riboflavin kinase, partial [Bdellovibrionales bacterium]
PYMIEGVKEVGDGRGIKLGFPTWNLKPEIETLLGAGVYITQFEISGKLYPAVTNVGFRPTFYSILKKNIETHVLTPFSDQSPSARIHFIIKIRDEKKFSAVEDLIEQIHTDIDSAKAFFNLPDKG